MSERRFRFGAVVTFIWFLTMAGLFYLSDSRAATMKANEWGDFFAGVFAPLAFLWLVLGYLQQGEELRLQAQELQNSVEQQRSLVEVSRQQLAAERDALTYEREQREALARPVLLLSGSGGAFSGDSICRYSLTVTNTGNAAIAFEVDLVPAGESPRRLFDASIFERGQQQRLTLEQPRPLEGQAQLVLNYRDTLGKGYGETYLLERETEDPRSLLAIRKVEA